MEWKLNLRLSTTACSTISSGCMRLTACCTSGSKSCTPKLLRLKPSSANSDKVPAKAVSRRRDGLHRLGALFAQPRTRSLALTQQTARGLSDLQFSNACLVPFQRSRGPRKHRQVASLVREPACVTVTDPGGNVFCDLTGTHGVNLLGTAFTSTAQPRALRVPTLWVWCRARTSLVL